MDDYEIDYIDGYTMKYNRYSCKANSLGEAVDSLKESQIADFDNRYLCILKNGDVVWEESF